MSDQLVEQTGSDAPDASSGASVEEAASANVASASEPADAASSASPAREQTVESVTAPVEKAAPKVEAEPLSEGSNAASTEAPKGGNTAQTADQAAVSTNAPKGGNTAQTADQAAVSTNADKASGSIDSVVDEKAAVPTVTPDSPQPSDAGAVTGGASTEALTKTTTDAAPSLSGVSDAAGAPVGSADPVVQAVEPIASQGAGTESLTGATDPAAATRHLVTDGNPAAGSGMLDPVVHTPAIEAVDGASIGAPGDTLPVGGPPAPELELPSTPAGPDIGLSAPAPVASIPDPGLSPEIHPAEMLGSPAVSGDGATSAVAQLGGPIDASAQTLPDLASEPAFTSGALADEPGGAVGSVAQVANTVGESFSVTADPVPAPSHSVAQSLLGPPDPLGGGMDIGTNAVLGGTDVAAPVLGGGGPRAFEESTRSFVDTVADGLSSTAAAYGRVGALVVLAGLMATRLSSSMTTVTAYAFAGAGETIRTGWLTSWGSARCLVANASRAVSAPFGCPSSGATSAVSAWLSGQGVLGTSTEGRTLRPFPGSLDPRGIVAAMDGGRRLDLLLRFVVAAAAGLLALAALPERVVAFSGRILHRRRLMLPARTRLTFAMLGGSMLLAVVIVLFLGE